MPNPFQELIDNTDWQLLVQQKLALLNDIQDDESLGAPPECLEDRQGLLHFIDAIQDAAAKVTGDDRVFGPKCPKCGSNIPFPLTTCINPECH